MKRTLILLACAFSMSSFAGGALLKCPQALPTDSPKFCPSFKSVAECHCVSAGLPKMMCQNVESIYTRMISMFGSLQKACEYQKDTTVQTCIDDWNCYRKGGKDSQGRLCSSTGKSCR